VGHVVATPAFHREIAAAETVIERGNLHSAISAANAPSSSTANAVWYDGRRRLIIRRQGILQEPCRIETLRLKRF
jgi:hypothetical protein